MRTVIERILSPLQGELLAAGSQIEAFQVNSPGVGKVGIPAEMHISRMGFMAWGKH